MKAGLLRHKRSISIAILYVFIVIGCISAYFNERGITYAALVAPTATTVIVTKTPCPPEGIVKIKPGYSLYVRDFPDTTGAIQKIDGKQRVLTASDGNLNVVVERDSCWYILVETNTLPGYFSSSNKYVDVVATATTTASPTRISLSATSTVTPTPTLKSTGTPPPTHTPAPTSTPLVFHFVCPKACEGDVVIQELP